MASIGRNEGGWGEWKKSSSIHSIGEWQLPSMWKGKRFCHCPGIASSIDPMDGGCLGKWICRWMDGDGLGFATAHSSSFPSLHSLQRGLIHSPKLGWMSLSLSFISRQFLKGKCGQNNNCWSNNLRKLGKCMDLPCLSATTYTSASNCGGSFSSIYTILIECHEILSLASIFGSSQKEFPPISPLNLLFIIRINWMKWMDGWILVGAH